MMAAPQLLRTGRKRLLSRFGVPCRRAPQSPRSRPRQRLAARKHASGFWSRKAAPRARQVALQVTETHQENAVFSYGIVLGCVVAPNRGPSAALFVTNGGTVVGQDPTDPTNPLSVQVGNRVNFSAVVTGVSPSDIEIRQTYDSSTGTSNITGNEVALHKPGSLDVVFFDGSSFGSHGSITDAQGTWLQPSVTVGSNGAVVFQFYDAPGWAGNPNDLTRTLTNNQTFTTTIINRSTNQVLAQQTWNTTATFRQDGTGSTTFRYHFP